MIKNLDRKTIELVTELLNRLPFVAWDRASGEWDLTTDGGDFSVYGWIDRDHDHYKDFVMIEFWLMDNGNAVGFCYDTSSAKYSEEIARLLNVDQHNSCQRVEDLFAGVGNTIRLDSRYRGK